MKVSSSLVNDGLALQHHVQKHFHILDLSSCCRPYIAALHSFTFMEGLDLGSKVAKFDEPATTHSNIEYFSGIDCASFSREQQFV